MSRGAPYLDVVSKIHVCLQESFDKQTKIIKMAEQAGVYSCELGTHISALALSAPLPQNILLAIRGELYSCLQGYLYSTEGYYWPGYATTPPGLKGRPNLCSLVFAVYTRAESDQNLDGGFRPSANVHAQVNGHVASSNPCIGITNTK